MGVGHEANYLLPENNTVTETLDIQERSIPGEAGSATIGTRTTWDESRKEAQRPIRSFATPKQTLTIGH